MIRVDIRRKAFGKTDVLGPVRFDVARGETVALIGPSGIGKSTLLRIVAGIDTSFEGVVDVPENKAMVFQEPMLLRWRSALQNLRLVHPDLPTERAEQMLARVGLRGKEDKFPGQLSLGQQRRLSLARAFVGRPDCLILDEPFVSLDDALAESMIALTEDLIEETAPATLFVTHSRAEAERLGDRVLTLGGTPATLTDVFG